MDLVGQRTTGDDWTDQESHSGSMISHWNMYVQIQLEVPQEYKGGVQKVQIPVIRDQQIPVVFAEMLGQTGKGFAHERGVDEGAVQLTAD